MNHPTGVRLLDQLLGGGLPPTCNILLYGPSFMGKEVLGRRIATSGAAKGVPTVIVLTNRTTAEARAELAAMDVHFPEREKEGLFWFVDCYSRSIGAEEPGPNVAYTDSAVDLNGLSVAINQIQGRIIAHHEHHLILVDSASTLVLYSNAATTFRFLQILTGKAKRAGASTAILLDEGMHTDAEVQMFRHLAEGVVSVRGDPGKHQLLVEGLNLRSNPGWIDYRFNDKEFEMTGSLAGGRIR
jgi:KaiC/GvpD/RAD55 family RecA-like ATPase